MGVGKGNTGQEEGITGAGRRKGQGRSGTGGLPAVMTCDGKYSMPIFGMDDQKGKRRITQTLN